MVAEFRGPSPHDLGTAELATVQVLEENIEVMLHLLDDWHRPGIVPWGRSFACR